MNVRHIEIMEKLEKKVTKMAGKETAGDVGF